MDDIASLQIRVLSQDVDSANKRLAQLENQGRDTERSVSKLGSASKITFGAIAAGLGSIVSLSAVTGMAVKQWLSYDKAMKEVQSISSSSRAEFQAMRTDVADLATELGVDATVAAKGLYQALSAGVPKENAIEFMKVASKSAVAGVTEVNVAVDGLTNVINAYKLPVSEAMNVSDKLFATVVAGKTTFEELSSNMSKASVMAASMDVPLEQLLASIIALTKLGTPTSEAFTQVKTALQALLDPADEMKVALDAMGVSSGKQAIAQYGLAGALQQVRDRYEGNDAALVKAMRSVEAYNGALSMTGTNLANYTDGLDAVNNSANTTNKAFKDNANTLESALTSVKGTFIGFVESMEQSFGIIQHTSNLLKELTGSLAAARDAQTYALDSAVKMGGMAGVQAVQNEIARLEAMNAKLEASRATGGIGGDEAGLTGLNYFAHGQGVVDIKQREIAADLEKARAALASFNQETVKSAALMRELDEATKAGDASAISGIEERINAQERSQAAAAEQAAILTEVGELELLLKGEMVKMADAQLEKDKEIAKAKEKADKEHIKNLDDIQKDAERLSTTEKERLNLQIKNLEALKAQRPETAAMADEAITAIRKQIVEYEKLKASKGDPRSGPGKGHSYLTGIPILGDALLTEESMIKDSYSRRGSQMLDDASRFAKAERAIIVNEQAETARARQEAMIGQHQFALTAYGEFFGNMSELSSFHSEKAFKVSQAFAIAQATVKMYEAAVAAYASGSAISPFLGPVFAAGALAAGAANIASIKSQSYQAYEHGGMIPSGGVGLVGEAGPEFVRGPAVVTSARATKGLRGGGDGESRPYTIIVNTPPGHEVTTRESDDGTLVEIAVQKAMGRLAVEAAKGGGKIFPEFARNHGLTRKGR